MIEKHGDLNDIQTYERTITFTNNGLQEDVDAVVERMVRLGIKFKKLGPVYFLKTTNLQAKILSEMKGVEGVGLRAHTF